MCKAREVMKNVFSGGAYDMLEQFLLHSGMHFGFLYYVQLLCGNSLHIFLFICFASMIFLLVYMQQLLPVATR